jgi:hypothetical protein
MVVSKYFVPTMLAFGSLACRAALAQTLSKTSEPVRIQTYPGVVLP